MAQLRKRVADKQMQGIAKIGNAVTAGEAKIDAAVANIEAKVDKEISASLQEFAQYSNGGPA